MCSRGMNMLDCPDHAHGPPMVGIEFAAEWEVYGSADPRLDALSVGVSIRNRREYCVRHLAFDEARQELRRVAGCPRRRIVTGIRGEDRRFCGGQAAIDGFVDARGDLPRDRELRATRPHRAGNPDRVIVGGANVFAILGDYPDAATGVRRISPAESDEYLRREDAWLTGNVIRNVQ